MLAVADPSWRWWEFGQFDYQLQVIHKWTKRANTIGYGNLFGDSCTSRVCMYD
jgi:hypothetical protein